MRYAEDSKTTFVTVNLLAKQLQNQQQINSKTTFVTVNLRITYGNVWRLGQIQKQHLLLLISIQQVFCALDIGIQKQHLLLLIFSNCFVSSAVKHIQKQHLLLLISGDGGGADYVITKFKNNICYC